MRHAMLAWQLSQFLHGEQGALMTASQLVSCVPWIDAKYYAATQAMDEARHVEVFSRYLREKLEWEFPINENLRKLLDAILTDERWDLKYLGMQILVEGLAMAAFGNLHQIADDPLLVELIHYVMRDEARHVAFGVLSLEGFYREMPERELRDREDFIIEASLLDARPADRRRDRRRDGLRPRGGARADPDFADHVGVPLAAVRARGAEREAARTAHAARAARLRADRRAPVRGRGSRGAGPRARAL